MRVHVCVCVCERERERERKKEFHVYMSTICYYICCSSVVAQVDLTTCDPSCIHGTCEAREADGNSLATCQ